MDWVLVVALCEIIGAVAVVGTLFYLSRQIRESNSYSKANTIRESNALYMQSYALLAQDNELASIHARAIDGESLDRVETVRYEAYLTNYFAMAEALYFQAKAGQVYSEYLGDGDAHGDAVIAIFRAYMLQLLTTTSGNAWWKANAPNHWSPEFIEKVKSIVLTASPERKQNAT